MKHTIKGNTNTSFKTKYIWYIHWVHLLKSKVFTNDREESNRKIFNKISNEEWQISDFKWRNIMKFLNVLKTSKVEGHVSCSFCPNLSQTCAKSLSLGKCSSHCISSELFYSRSNEKLLILWSHGSAGHPLLMLILLSANR